MGKSTGKWDLPKILPCRECMKHIFSSVEHYHRNCHAETEETFCSYCEEHDLECQHLPESLVDMCSDIYEQRKLLFASKTRMTRFTTMAHLDLTAREFSLRLKKIEEAEEAERNRQKRIEAILKYNLNSRFSTNPFDQSDDHAKTEAVAGTAAEEDEKLKLARRKTYNLVYREAKERRRKELQKSCREKGKGKDRWDDYYDDYESIEDSGEGDEDGDFMEAD